VIKIWLYVNRYASSQTTVKFERCLIASDAEEKHLLPHRVAQVVNGVYAEDLPKRKTTKGPSPTPSDALKAIAIIGNPTTPHN